jgi:hypothetical protein
MATYYHNTLNERESLELRNRMDKAESDTFKVYELAKIFKTLWRSKTHELYTEIYNSNIQPEVIGRALSDLCAMGYLFDTKTTELGNKGAKQMVYQLSDVEPINPIKIPKKICVTLQFTEINGKFELDIETMSNEFIDKLNFYDNIFNN